MNKPVHLWFLTFILVCVFAISGCSLLPGEAAPTPTVLAPVVSDSRTIADGVVVPQEFVSLGFLVSGEVAEVYVDEGDTVEAGALLALVGNPEALEAEREGVALELLVAQQALDDLNLYANVDQKLAAQRVLDARLAVVAAQQALDALDEDQYQDDLGQARADIADAKTTLEDAQDALADYQDLDPQNATRQQYEDELVIAQEDYNAALSAEERLLVSKEQLDLNLESAKAQLTLAEAEVEKRTDGPEASQLLRLETQIQFLEKQLAALAAALENMKVIAPIAGTVVAVKIKAGETAVLGQPVFTIADFSTWYVETSDLTELEVVKVEEAQQVSVIPEALPEEELSGIVERIGQVGTTRQGDVTYLTRIKLEETDLPLRWGMTVTVYFEP